MDMCYQCNVVHDEQKCPLCKARAEIEDLEEKLNNAEDEIKNLNKQVEELEDARN